MWQTSGTMNIKGIDEKEFPGYISSYWNKRELNQLLPQNNKGLEGHLERFEFVFY